MTPIARPVQRKWNLGSIALWIVSVLSVILVMIGLFGNVNGEEFSPDNFTRRSFGFYRIPLIKLQVSPVWRDSTTSKLERRIGVYARKNPAENSTKSATQPTKGTSEPLEGAETTGGSKETALQWDGIAAGIGNVNQWVGNSKILCDYLDMKTGSGKSQWLQWTNDHPQAADILWPRIVKIARYGLYHLSPGMFEIAENTTEPEALESALDRFLVRELHQSADNLSDLGEEVEAARLRSFARNIDGELFESLNTAAPDA